MMKVPPQHHCTYREIQMDRNLSIKHFTYFVAVSTLFVSAGTHSLADVKVVSQITVTGELNTGTTDSAAHW